jgi:cytoskeleton protein RodZ
MTDAPSPTEGPGRVEPVDLGAQLVALRTTAGLSVEDVAARTRIRASLIRSMEDGDFAPCGGAVYARGHLRSIAHVIGADDAALVTAYDRMAGQPSPSAATVVDEHYAERPAAVPFAGVAERTLPVPVQVTGSSERSAGGAPVRAGGPTLLMPGASSGVRERRGNPWVMAMVGVLTLVVVVAGIVLAIPSHHSARTTATAHTASPSTSPATTHGSAAATPTAPATLADAGVNVTVSILASASWVHVTDGTGTLVFQGILSPGASKAFHSAQELTFIFGYAPAVHLIVNGHDIGSPPANKGGDVANAVFTTSSGG